MHQLIADLRGLGGYYSCPRGTDGRRLGPLVAYAGTYDDQGTQKRFVGDEYFNFAMFEQNPARLQRYTAHLADDISKVVLRSQVTFCGMPEGGKSIALQLALLMSARYVYPEKKDSGLMFSRHEIIRGELVFLVEDVANNFSTTGKAIDLVRKAGGLVQGIVCLLNRSPNKEHDSFFFHNGGAYNIISSLRMPADEYRQDAPEVRDDVEAKNICWYPKVDWVKLQKAMQDAGAIQPK